VVYLITPTFGDAMTAARDLPPLAFIYDRLATPSRGVLDHRLAVCHEYAAERRWEVAGEWVDEGDFALRDDRRPQLDALLRALADAARTQRAVVCLVYDWGRFAHTPGPNTSMRYKVTTAGGWTETKDGEKDMRQPQTAYGRAR
jgi:hypothetical protein